MTGQPPSQDQDARIIVSREGGVARLTLSNPRRKNAITLEMGAAIEAFCDEVAADEAIGAVLVAGAGGYFCSGGDTRVLAASSADPASPGAVASVSAIYRSFTRVGSLPVPTVALVEGGAVGAGMNLALATDLLLVTPDAQLDSGFLARGIHPGGGHIALLGRRVGYQQAAAMTLLGQALSGREAVEHGLAYAAVPADELLTVAMELVALAAGDPQLTRRVKQSLALELGAGPVSWPAAVEIERGAQMWSLARKGSAGWDRKPPRPAAEEPGSTPG
ncbi:MAG TPA: enoyl-CoA hydratase/isomerase family protein [Trebonia sp.]|nr:enoyl-CoA hydratase/isomerase family protein [Trebonia sp.]